MNTDKLQDYNADLKFRRFNVTTNVNMNITRSTKLDIGIRGFLVILISPISVLLIFSGLPCLLRLPNTRWNIREVLFPERIPTEGIEIRGLI